MHSMSSYPLLENYFKIIKSVVVGLAFDIRLCIRSLRQYGKVAEFCSDIVSDAE